MTGITFFIIFVPILSIILLAVNLVFASHNPYDEKRSTFECGFHSFLGQNRTQFNISFFIFALLFLLFDLEILLIYPYSVSHYTNELYGLVIMLIFFIILTIGFTFEFGKKALKIDSKQLIKNNSLSKHTIQLKNSSSNTIMLLSSLFFVADSINFNLILDWSNTPSLQIDLSTSIITTVVSSIYIGVSSLLSSSDITNTTNIFSNILSNNILPDVSCIKNYMYYNFNLKNLLLLSLYLSLPPTLVGICAVHTTYGVFSKVYNLIKYFKGKIKETCTSDANNKRKISEIESNDSSSNKQKKIKDNASDNNTGKDSNSGGNNGGGGGKDNNGHDNKSTLYEIKNSTSTANLISRLSVIQSDFATLETDAYDILENSYDDITRAFEFQNSRDVFREHLVSMDSLYVEYNTIVRTLVTRNINVTEYQETLNYLIET